MIVAQGNVSDRPFARTIFSLASKRFTGDLILVKSRKEYRCSWEAGQIVAAHSASPSDAPGRVALSAGLVNSSTLGIFIQKQSEDSHRPAMEVLTEVAQLSKEQQIHLKRQVLARTASRIFALPDADFTVDNARSMSADPEIPALDVRWLIYYGLRTHYSLARLEGELSAVGNRSFTLNPQAQSLLPAFGYGEEESPVLAKLQGTSLSLPNLIAECESTDPATTTCIVYALMACGYLNYGTEQGLSRRARDTLHGASKTVSNAPTLAKGTDSSNDFVSPAPQKKLSAEGSVTKALIEEKIALIDADASHYELLGMSNSASDTDIRKEYFALARKLHPDRIRAVGLDDAETDSQRLFAAINKAFAVLSNSKDRQRYNEVLAAGGEKAYQAKQREAEELAIKVFRAEEHFHLGEMALRRDQFKQAESEFRKAVELAPNESEYLALHAWAHYCCADNREEIASEAMGQMSSALLKGPKSPTTRLYHAKLLKLMGRNEEALASFKKLLELSPGNREAELEIRLLSQRERQDSEKKKGLFKR